MATKTIKKSAFVKGSVAYEIASKPEVVLDCDLDRFSNGFLHISITDVKIRQDSKEVGSISVDVQGCAVHAIIGSRTWSISMRELWPLFVEADERYVKESK